MLTYGRYWILGNVCLWKTRVTLEKQLTKGNKYQMGGGHYCQTLIYLFSRFCENDLGMLRTTARKPAGVM